MSAAAIAELVRQVRLLAPTSEPAERFVCEHDDSGAVRPLVDQALVSGGRPRHFVVAADGGPADDIMLSLSDLYRQPMRVEVLYPVTAELVDHWRRVALEDARLLIAHLRNPATAHLPPIDNIWFAPDVRPEVEPIDGAEGQPVALLLRVPVQVEYFA